MSWQAAERGFRTAAGTSIAVAVLLCAWSSRAEAGCSHYAVPKTESGQLALRHLGFEPGSGIDLARETPPRPRPCSGALCSGRPAVPVPVPVAVGRSLEKALVGVPINRPVAPAMGQPLASADRIVRPVREAPSIHRPPR